MQNLVLNGGDQRLQLLRLGANALRTKIGMTGDRTVQSRLLLTMGRIGHRQTLKTTLRLSGGDVEDKVCVLNTIAGLRIAIDSTVLTSGIAHATDLEKIIKVRTVFREINPYLEYRENELELISLLIKPTHSDAGSITLTIDLRLDKLSLDHTAKMYKFH